MWRVRLDIIYSRRGLQNCVSLIKRGHCQLNRREEVGAGARLKRQIEIGVLIIGELAALEPRSDSRQL